MFNLDDEVLWKCPFSEDQQQVTIIAIDDVPVPGMFDIYLGIKGYTSPHLFCANTQYVYARYKDTSKTLRFSNNLEQYPYGKWVHSRHISKLSNSANVGYNCIICNQHYPYAQPNLPNNQLKCYSCRNT